MQEIEESYYAEVRHPSVVPGEVVLTSNLIDCRYWKRQLGLFRRVVVAKLFQKTCYWEVERVLCWGGSSWVLMSVQNVLLGNGSESFLD